LSDTEREIPAEYEPTADQRALVESAAAFGLTQADTGEQREVTAEYEPTAEQAWLMTKLLEQAVEAARALPPEMQEAYGRHINKGRARVIR
jgi:hypothetical protein